MIVLDHQVIPSLEDVNKDLWEEDSNGETFQRLNIPIFVRSSDDEIDKAVKAEYGNAYFFFEGKNKRIQTQVTLPLSIWLKLAGVDSLDAPNGPTYLSELYPGTTFSPPRYRLTGVQIDVLAKFTNEDPRPVRVHRDGCLLLSSVPFLPCTKYFSVVHVPFTGQQPVR